eukprot:COSAG01_NODE_978_length_12357_cov_10.838554_12_plen_59_part_00
MNMRAHLCLTRWVHIICHVRHQQNDASCAERWFARHRPAEAAARQRLYDRAEYLAAGE